MRRGVGVLPFLSALLSASLASESFSQAACAADGPPPTFALLLVGNFRTFYDPRVYKSIRTNLIDALGEAPIRTASRAEIILRCFAHPRTAARLPAGAPSVVFIYGKLDSENVRGQRRDTNSQIQSGGPNYSPRQRPLEQMTKAAAHLSAHGGPRVVMDVVNSSRSSTLINPGCPWLAFQGKDRFHWEEGYVGQLQSHAMGYAMMDAYEKSNNMKFDYVAKVRLDAMWINGVRPWCTLRRDAAYVIWPQPADWFQLVPRAVATKSLRDPFARYQSCKTVDDMVRWQAQCCGGGPTAQLLGAVMEARVPIIGPEYVGSKWGTPPAGSYVMPWLWPMVVMRDDTYNDWCKKEMIAPRYPEWPRPGMPGNTQGDIWGHWRFFYDQYSCERVIDPEASRYKIPGAHKPEPKPTPTEEPQHDNNHTHHHGHHHGNHTKPDGSTESDDDTDEQTDD